MTTNFIYLAVSLILVDNVLFSNLFGIEPLFVKFQTRKAARNFALFAFCIALIAGVLSVSVAQLLKLLSVGTLSTFFTTLITLGIVYMVRSLLQKNGSKSLKDFTDNTSLISINCIALIATQISLVNSLSFIQSILVVMAASVGYVVSLFLLESIKEKLEGAKVSVLILSISFAALAFSGFIGVGM